MSAIKIFGLLIACAAPYFESVYAQVLDTDINARITYNDSLTFDIRKNRFLQVTLHSPKLIRQRGKKVKSAKGKFFIYVVRCPRLTINGYEVQKGPSDVYLAAVSKQKRIYSLPDSVPTTANFLKGVVDNADSMVKFFKQQLLSNQKEADSLAKLIHDLRYPGVTLYSQFQKIDEFMSTDLYYYHFFRIFRYAKRKKKLPEFFLSPYYNQRFLHTNINKMPYGLPKIEQDTLAPKPSFLSILFGKGESEKTGIPLPAQLEKQQIQTASPQNQSSKAEPTPQKLRKEGRSNSKEKEKEKNEGAPPTAPMDKLEDLPQQ